MTSSPITKGERKNLRAFGLLVGAIFTTIGMWPAVWHGDMPRAWALVAGAGLFALGLAAPAALKPVHHLWMTIGHALGWVNTRVLLGLIFYGVVTPMGLVMRAMGKDTMRRAFVEDMQTYRVPKQPRHPTHVTHQF